MSPARIVPALDEPENRELRFAPVFEAMLNEQFALECRVETFTHGVVVTVTDRTHRGPNAGFLTTFAECNRGVLAALIGMMNNVVRFSAVERHVERIEYEFGAQVIRHCPADDAPTENVEYDRKEQKSAPRWNVRDIGDPKLIGSARCKVAIDQIRPQAVRRGRESLFCSLFACWHQRCYAHALIARHACRSLEGLRRANHLAAVRGRRCNAIADNTLLCDRRAIYRLAAVPTARGCTTRSSRLRRPQTGGTSLERTGGFWRGTTS